MPMGAPHSPAVTIIAGLHVNVAEPTNTHAVSAMIEMDRIRTSASVSRSGTRDSPLVAFDQIANDIYRRPAVEQNRSDSVAMEIRASDSHVVASGVDPDAAAPDCRVLNAIVPAVPEDCPVARHVVDLQPSEQAASQPRPVDAIPAPGNIV